jgi:hypothetical protein
MSSSRKEPSPSKVLDLEIKDARVIFNPIWESLEEEVGRREPARAHRRRSSAPPAG